MLFGGEALLGQMLAEALAAASSAYPVAVAQVGLQAIAAALEPHRQPQQIRTRIIVANPELQERELTKLNAWSLTIASDLKRRGVADSTAAIIAEASMAVFRLAFKRWALEESVTDLTGLVNQGLGELGLFAVLRTGGGQRLLLTKRRTMPTTASQPFHQVGEEPFFECPSPWVGIHGTILIRR